MPELGLEAKGSEPSKIFRYLHEPSAIFLKKKFDGHSERRRAIAHEPWQVPEACHAKNILGLQPMHLRQDVTAGNVTSVRIADRESKGSTIGPYLGIQKLFFAKRVLGGVQMAAL